VKPGGAASTSSPWLIQQTSSRFKSAEQIGIVAHVELRLAILAARTGAHDAAELARHQLHPVADAEDRQTAVVHGGVHRRRIGFIAGGGTSGEDDTEWFALQYLLQRSVIGHDLTVNFALPDTAGDQLGVLRSEIQDNDIFFGEVQV
jgi:hypothetical protein